MQRPLRRSRSFKVTDFGTNRKLIYDFLLVINTNLPPILHRYQVMADYWSNLRQREQSVSLYRSRWGVTPANIAINELEFKFAKNYTGVDTRKKRKETSKKEKCYALQN